MLGDCGTQLAWMQRPHPSSGSQYQWQPPLAVMLVLVVLAALVSSSQPGAECPFVAHRTCLSLLMQPQRLRMPSFVLCITPWWSNALPSAVACTLHTVDVSHVRCSHMQPRAHIKLRALTKTSCTHKNLPVYTVDTCVCTLFAHATSCTHKNLVHSQKPALYTVHICDCTQLLQTYSLLQTCSCTLK